MDSLAYRFYWAKTEIHRRNEIFRLSGRYIHFGWMGNGYGGVSRSLFDVVCHLRIFDLSASGVRYTWPGLFYEKQQPRK